MKTKTQTHTPTPWQIQKYQDLEELVSEIYSAEEDVSICQTRTKVRWGIAGEGLHRNAEFIVRAVNNHEALLEAAKIACDALKRLGQHAGHIERAIAQAEGCGS